MPKSSPAGSTDPEPEVASGAAAAHAAEVARYYDANTRRFLAVGPRRGSASIHRELWGPGVASRVEAVAFVDRLLVDEIRSRVPGAHSVLDLGCGVGGTAYHLATSLPEIDVTGVTISRLQLRLAAEGAEARGLGGRCRFLSGDFGASDVGSGFDAAVGVESLAHAARPSDFFAGAARALAPGGLLLVVDDFLTRPRDELLAAQRGAVDDFRAGWRVPSVDTVEVAISAAAEEGFDAVEARDLSGFVRTGRPRDRLIGLLAPAFRVAGLRRIPFFGNMIGGDALRRGLRCGFVAYRLLVFELARSRPVGTHRAEARPRSLP